MFQSLSAESGNRVGQNWTLIHGVVGGGAAFGASSWAPWYVVHSDNKRRARLNALTHILSKIPYEELPRANIELQKRQHHGDYKEIAYPFRVIPEAF